MHEQILVRLDMETAATCGLTEQLTQRLASEIHEEKAIAASAPCGAMNAICV